MSAQELRAFILQSSQRGLMIHQALEVMQQVMDSVQVQQLSLNSSSSINTLIDC